MSRLGTGSPVFLADGSTYTYPHTLSGGRSEEWVEELEQGWTNLGGDYIDGERSYRFRGEYTWRGLSSAEANRLVQWHNQQQRFVFRPYSDNTAGYQFLCRIAELELPPPDVLAMTDTVRLVVEAVSRVASIPIPDLRLVGDRVPHAGII
jgi:hypothetical protein